MVHEVVARKRGLRFGPVLSLMRVAGNDLGAEGGAAVGRLFTALTALQTLNLSSKAPCFFGFVWGFVLWFVRGL